VLAGLFTVLPESIWSHVPEPPGGWLPDYAILGLNLALFWVSVWLVWILAGRLFDGRAAVLAARLTAVSVTLLQQTVVVSGLPLLMVLVLAVFAILAGLEQETAEYPVLTRVVAWRVAALGGLGALMFLTEYSAGLVLPVIGGYLGWRLAGRVRWPALGIFAGVAVLVVAPWLVRNIAVAGHPLGLAWQNLALKADDPTAYPWAQRNTAGIEAPGLDVRKLGNKGLTAMRVNLQERIWSGGAMLLSAFFIAGLAYQFRNQTANRTRWCFAVLLLVMLGGQAFFGSGESPRLPAYYLAPLIVVFGTGFFFVLVDSQPRLAAHATLVAWALLVVQALPVARDVAEPRKIHFYYPPYFPNLFIELRHDTQTRFLPGTGVATDVPAGTAWYGQMRVWSKPERLHDFYAISVEQSIGALLLTPVTLDRPFFTELAARKDEAIQLSDTGGWGGVYTGLVTRRMPAGFPLNAPPQRLTDNMVLLVNPSALNRRGN
jgi:MFS family permease